MAAETRFRQSIASVVCSGTETVVTSRAGAFEAVRRIEHEGVDVLFAIGQSEAFFQNSDAKSLAAGLD